MHTQISLRMNYLHLLEAAVLARVTALITRVSAVNVYQLANQCSREYMACLQCYKVDIILQLASLQLESNHTALHFFSFFTVRLQKIKYIHTPL